MTLFVPWANSFVQTKARGRAKALTKRRSVFSDDDCKDAVDERVTSSRHRAPAGIGPPYVDWEPARMRSAVRSGYRARKGDSDRSGREEISEQKLDPASALDREHWQARVTVEYQVATSQAMDGRISCRAMQWGVVDHAPIRRRGEKALNDDRDEPYGRPRPLRGLLTAPAGHAPR